MPTYTPLQSIQLATDTASFTFSNIPQTYQDLVLVCNYLKSSNAALRLSFNGDTATNYSQTVLYGNGTNALSNRETSVSYFYAMDFVTNTLGIPNQTIININNYSNTTTYKTILDRSGGASDGVVASVGLWRKSTEAINNINISRSGGIFSAGATFDLYGISPVAAQTAQAFGGTEIYYDTSYVYHVFKGSGTFTPYRALTADYLVIAGGGGGGAVYGAGGGAGGYLTSGGTQGGGGSAGSALSLTANTSYTVTVGAGGPAGIQGTNNGSASNGSDSVFSTITSTGGGGGAGNGNADPQNAGGNGGSSGGGAYASGAAGTRTASPVQGYNGAAGPGGFFGGGGGGGAGGAGVLGSDATGCNGGAGLNSVSTWATVTGTGVNGYYAGGGGAYYTGVSSNGGSGGGGTGGGVGGSGVTNTGSGGGGSTINQVAGNGGSGIVIVRYAR